MSDIDNTIRMFEEEISKVAARIDAGKAGDNPQDVAALADNKAYHRRLKNSLRQIVNLELASQLAKQNS